MRKSKCFTSGSWIWSITYPAHRVRNLWWPIFERDWPTRYNTHRVRMSSRQWRTWWIQRSVPRSAVLMRAFDWAEIPTPRLCRGETRIINRALWVPRNPSKVLTVIANGSIITLQDVITTPTIPGIAPLDPTTTRIQWELTKSTPTALVTRNRAAIDRSDPSWANILIVEMRLIWRSISVASEVTPEETASIRRRSKNFWNRSWIGKLNQM